jgi:hypothetical protein
MSYTSDITTNTGSNTLTFVKTDCKGISSALAHLQANTPSNYATTYKETNLSTHSTSDTGLSINTTSNPEAKLGTKLLLCTFSMMIMISDSNNDKSTKSNRQRRRSFQATRGFSKKRHRCALNLIRTSR